MHRFEVGQMLTLRSAPRHSNRPAGPCEVIACMPHEKGPVLYRVKSLGENIERVVDEADLTPCTTLKTAVEPDDDAFSIAIVKR